MSHPKKKKDFVWQTNPQTQEFSRLHLQLVKRSSACSSRRPGRSGCLCLCDRLSGPRISLNESHLFFSLLLFLLHLFLVLLS